MLMKIYKLEKYLKKSTDPGDKRRYERLPINIPIVYRFPDAKKTGARDFRQCNTFDVSSSGIGIQVINPSDDVNKKITRNGQKIIMRIDVPKTEDLIEIKGLVRWSRTDRLKDNFQVFAGVEFDEADYDKRVSILSYALNLKKRKQAVKLAMVSLLILFCGALAWGSQTFLSKQEVEKKLDISEINRRNLEKEIRALIDKKNKIEAELEANTARIKQQSDELKLQNEALKKLKEELRKDKEELANHREMIADFEEKVYNYVVVAAQENIIIEDSMELSAFQNETYINANRALNNKNTAQAIELFRKYIQEKPRSALGYSGLARALYRADKEKEARKVFKKYLELVNAKRK